MDAEKMLHLSECDFKVCVDLEKQFPQDHAVRAAAFHLQQAVEKMLKSAIRYNGGVPADTNDIGYLATAIPRRKCTKNQAKTCINGFCADFLCTFSKWNCCKQCEPFGIVFDEFIADTLTLWEMQSRYEPHISFTQEKYDRAKQAYIDIFQKLEQDMARNIESGFELKM